MAEELIVCHFPFSPRVKEEEKWNQSEFKKRKKKKVLLDLHQGAEFREKENTGKEDGEGGERRRRNIIREEKQNRQKEKMKVRESVWATSSQIKISFFPCSQIPPLYSLLTLSPLSSWPLLLSSPSDVNTVRGNSRLHCCDLHCTALQSNNLTEGSAGVRMPYCTEKKKKIPQLCCKLQPGTSRDR